MTIQCMCENTCIQAPRDGVCDDGGPGNDYAECNLGTDCADCGARAGPAAVFRRESYNVSGTETEHFSQMLQRLDSELIGTQIASCILPQYRQSVCPDTNSSGRTCQNLGLDGDGHPLCRAREPLWVDGTPEQAETQCEAAFDSSLTAVQMSSSGAKIPDPVDFARAV